MTDRNNLDSLKFHRDKIEDAKEVLQHEHTGTCEHDTAEAALTYHLDSTLDHIDHIIKGTE